MKKMYQVGVVLLSIVFNLGSLRASIVYTDIPDQSLIAGGNAIDIDLNNDGIVDFTFEDTPSWVNGFTPYVSLNESTAFVVTGTLAQNGDDIKGLPDNTTINGNSNFIIFGPGADAFVAPSWGDGTFPIGVDTYLGVAFNIGFNEHFGWIRVNFDQTTFIVKDFAYESIGMTPIVTGQTGANFVEEFGSKIVIDHIFITPISDVAVLRLNASEEVVLDMKIFDLSGKYIRSKQVFLVTGSNDVEMKIADLTIGLYLISIDVNGVWQPKTIRFLKTK